MSDATLRSTFLTVIYQMLPNIDDDYAAKLVYASENKKTPQQLQQDIADVYARLNSDAPTADTIAAQVLLEEMTVAAALRHLHIYNNATSISELAEQFELTEKQTRLLRQVYASFASRLYFDNALKETLLQLEEENLPEHEKQRKALQTLADKAEQYLVETLPHPLTNKHDILMLADDYHLPFRITAQLLKLYTQPETVLFRPEFERIYAEISAQNEKKELCAMLAARVMLSLLSAQDAQHIAQLDRLIGLDILPEDLLVFACRYLRVKTPQEIVSIFNSVLQKLPHAVDPSENVGLAVYVMLEGTEASLRYACEQAARRRDKIILRKQLEKRPLYNGYETELAERFGGEKDFIQLEKDLREQLSALPYCEDPQENKELACKLLLNTLSQEEAVRQAQYLRDLKAKARTQGLTPEVLKNYLGTKPAEEVLEFLDSSLAAYNFWKSDGEKHIFALHTLIGELNGRLSHRMVQVILGQLEKGEKVEEVSALVRQLEQQKSHPQQLQELLDKYPL